jgi:nucleotide-binding universal stress UspA family protein
MALTWKKLCCPIDFSPPSQGALSIAAALASELGASLTLLHVHTVPGSSIPEGLLEPARDLERDLSGPAERTLPEWIAKAESLGAPRVEGAASVGDPADEIVAFARRGGFDAIVIGTHGRTGLQHALLGSVAEKVVRRAPCAVVSVTQDAAARAG